MDGIPVIDSSLLPADVRAASATDRRRYAAALQFEQMLLQRMLAESGTLAGGDDETADAGDGDDAASTDATAAHYAQMLPELLARSVTEAGGLGLARSIYDGLRERS